MLGVQPIKETHPFEHSCVSFSKRDMVLLFEPVLSNPSASGKLGGKRLAGAQQGMRTGLTLVNLPSGGFL